ncbi:helicase SNF2 [Actinoplanes sp. SE50]|uniref:DEAD/DEAH box helicase n=1 Tax=unclassified Actinoplanes TaxID=2626549 RepID=UPI00023EC1D1|nr:MULTISPECIES: DEAD/DEAH box helicase [unclassified Actinoplanes]AEV81335.1 non-specific serine/threonine protein kinase [Actinoplanes sp. SE50/110]ATO79738.1 helicase SNF2 [Actinoplanes sp. SE50]SLL97141.1 helicase SNF2 [Actinoplanes sp. SE50/110]
MLVVHGGWAPGSGRPGRLLLWAEEPSRTESSSASRAKVRPHPFAATATVLTTALGDLPSEPTAGIATIQLPGTARGPLPSPDTGVETTSPRGVRLAGWTVPVLAVPGEAALAVLATIAEPDPAAPWVPGPSLRYLGLLAGWACDLARHGRMLPQLVLEEGVPAARWRSVITGADLATYRDFAAGMPPVARAVTPAGQAVTPAGQQAGRTLRDALETMLDAAARSVLPEKILGGHRAGLRAPLADRWVTALTAPDPTLPGAAAAELRELRRALDDWMRAAQAANEPVRVSFRLIEPEPGEDDWELEFALQSAEDSALYLPAEAVWAGERFPGLPRRPDETLLAGLGRAVRLFPALHEALRTQQPAAMTLDTAEAYDFLRQAAPLLQAAGFGVQLPSWAGRKGVGLKLTTRSKSRAGTSRAVADSGFGLSEIVAFRLDLVIGDGVVSAAELAELARLKVPLVRVRGQWVELDDRQLKAALKAVGRRREGELTAAEILQQVVEGGEEDLPLVEVDADGTLGDLLSGQASERLDPMPTPPGFQGALRPYQERGLSWLHFLSRLGLGGILADDMGLGKTAQTLSLLLTGQADETRPAERTLLICPMSLITNWRKEAARFAPSLRVYVHHGATRQRGEDFRAAVDAADLVLTTYGTAARDLEALREVEWSRVACDEAQAIKNHGTRQSQAVRAIPARTRLALTGTPVENHLAELWSIMDFCNPGLLGPAKRFRRRFQEPIEINQSEDATAALKRATGPFVLRRLKTDKTIISDLPEKNEMKVWCSLTAEQATLYQAVVEDMMSEIEGSEGIQRRGNVLAAMMKLKQVCNHPAHLLKDGSRLPDRSGKLARLEELAEEIVEDGDKALVFTQYAEWGSLLQPYLAAHLDRPVLWLHGGLSKSRRDELVERFQTSPEPMLFLLSLKAAGTGLNLTAANHVVHFDRWWNPAVEDQATDRAFRIGQSRDVQVRKFICTGTLEEKIDAMIERKKALASAVVGTGEEWITDLSTDQLRELFALDPGVVG